MGWGYNLVFPTENKTHAQLNWKSIKNKSKASANSNLLGVKNCGDAFMHKLKQFKSFFNKPRIFFCIRMEHNQEKDLIIN